MKLQTNNKISNLRYIAIMGLLIALSGIGAQFKVYGSIALDSLPGFFAALFLGPVSGGIVGILGHLLSALTAGFPLTLPMHIIVSLQMFFILAIFSVLWKKTTPYLAIIAGILLNGPASALLAVPISIFLGLPFNGWALFHVIWLPLTLASCLNIIIAALVYHRFMGALKNVRY